MGLAASQARLLTITARKADCEFQSMSLSHQKLALARDMENVSNEYQDALNTTKLVYDYYGSGDSDMALTYDLLMSPSVYNDYYPKLVTDAKNRVILNSSYAAAARAAGIPAEGLSGTPSSDVRNKFIEALVGENIITANKAASIEGVTYGNTLGLGDTVSVTQSTTNISYDDLLDLLNTYSADSASDGVLLGKANADPQAGKEQRLVTIAEDGTYSEDTSSGATITLADLLSGKTQYIIAYESQEGVAGNYPVDAAHRLQQDLLSDGEHGSKSVLSWIQDAFTTVLGGTSASDTALDYAYNAVYDLIWPNSELADAAGDGTRNQEVMDTVGTLVRNKKNDNGYKKDVAQASPNYLGMTYSHTKNYGGIKGWFHNKKNDNTTVSINLNNVAQVFLTAYVQYMEGIENSNYSWQLGEKSKSNLYDGDKDEFEFTIVGDTSTSEEDSDVMASFYDTMFNMICLNGWTENAQIDDSDYLSEMLKSGMAYISSISDDGYYYQGNYSTDQYILEVTDDEAISRAEAKYNTEKTKIENKEDTIDLKMKNLDTEISSLTTEYDTTKSVISKSIEKSFKRYDA